MRTSRIFALARTRSHTLLRSARHFDGVRLLGNTHSIDVTLAFVRRSSRMVAASSERGRRSDVRTRVAAFKCSFGMVQSGADPVSSNWLQVALKTSLRRAPVRRSNIMAAAPPRSSSTPSAVLRRSTSSTVRKRSFRFSGYRLTRLQGLSGRSSHSTAKDIIFDSRASERFAAPLRSTIFAMKLCKSFNFTCSTRIS